MIKQTIGSLQVAVHMQHMLLHPQSAETLTPSYTRTSWRATAAMMPFPPAPNWSFLTRRCRCETFGWGVRFTDAWLKYSWPFWCVLTEKMFVFVRWRRRSLLWWLMVWGQRHCGTASLSVLWVSSTGVIKSTEWRMMWMFWTENWEYNPNL